MIMIINNNNGNMSHVVPGNATSGGEGGGGPTGWCRPRLPRLVLRVLQGCPDRDSSLSSLAFCCKSHPDSDRLVVAVAAAAASPQRIDTRSEGPTSSLGKWQHRHRGRAAGESVVKRHGTAPDRRSLPSRRCRSP
jgi:hypothetical protein